MREVIGVLPRRPLSASQSESLIQACCLSLVFIIPDDPEAAVLCSPGLGDVRGSVCRSVIDDQKLEIAERLSEDALDRRLEKASGVEYGHQDTDGRFIHEKGRGEKGSRVSPPTLRRQNWHRHASARPMRSPAAGEPETEPRRRVLLRLA